MSLERMKLTTRSRPIDVFLHWRREGYLNLNPPYQRGDVWGGERQRNLIRSLLLGIPIASVIVNDRFDAKWGEEIVVIDGKQRITTILKFLDDSLQIPRDWVSEEDIEMSPCGLVSFKDCTLRFQRHFRNATMATCEGQLPSEDAEREVFELVNFGGVPQGETDNATD